MGITAQKSKRNQVAKKEQKLSLDGKEDTNKQSDVTETVA